MTGFMDAGMGYRCITLLPAAGSQGADGAGLDLHQAGAAAPVSGCVLQSLEHIYLSIPPSPAPRERDFLWGTGPRSATFSVTPRAAPCRMHTSTFESGRFSTAFRADLSLTPRFIAAFRSDDRLATFLR